MGNRDTDHPCGPSTAQRCCRCRHGRAGGHNVVHQQDRLPTAAARQSKRRAMQAIGSTLACLSTIIDSSQQPPGTNPQTPRHGFGQQLGLIKAAAAPVSPGRWDPRSRVQLLSRAGHVLGQRTRQPRHPGPHTAVLERGDQAEAQCVVLQQDEAALQPGCMDFAQRHQGVDAVGTRRQARSPTTRTRRPKQHGWIVRRPYDTPSPRPSL